MIEVKSYPMGDISTNTYVITDKKTGEVAIIDPAEADKTITADLLIKGKGKVKYILLTHGHFDHIGGAVYYKEKLGADILISKEDEPFLHDNRLNLSAYMGGNALEPFCADKTLEDGEIITLGESKIRFILTPGHTCGSGCFVLEEDKIIFSGDTLFFRSMGRVDFPTSNPSQMISSLKRLATMQGDYKVYPGHDRATSLQDERKNNIYMKNN